MSSTSLKFNLDSFRELDAPDLIINVWSYSDHLKRQKNCQVCKIYCKHSLKALKEKWKKEWGSFNYIMSKIKKNDRYFIDVGKYSSADRYLIVDFLKKTEAARKQLVYKSGLY